MVLDLDQGGGITLVIVRFVVNRFVENIASGEWTKTKMELGYSLCCTQVSLICNDKNGCSILQSIDNNNPGKSYTRHSKVLSYDSHSQTIGTFTFIIILMLNNCKNHSTLLVSVQIVNAGDLKYTMMS